jgi:alkanesulfonate monooxygenase
VRETTAEAWSAAEAKLRSWEANRVQRTERNVTGKGSVGQARLRELMASGEVLDRCLWTAPAQVGTGAATTWLVGSAEDVIRSLEDYAALGMTHFVISDTPYLDEAVRVGNAVVTPMLAPGSARPPDSMAVAG